MSTRDAPRLRAPRRIRPGASRERRTGERISCAVLAGGPEEWVAVDLASGALVRARPAPAGCAAVAGTWSPFDVAQLELAEDGDPPDPARPEAVAINGEPDHVGRLGPRSARLLLARLAAPEQRWLGVLGTRGPSVAYVDLELSSSSLSLVTTSTKSLECFARADGTAVCAFTWSGTTQTLPLLDDRVRRLVLASAPPHVVSADVLASAVGGKPGYLLVGLAAVRAGHAPKAVLSILPRRPSKA